MRWLLVSVLTTLAGCHVLHASGRQTVENGPGSLRAPVAPETQSPNVLPELAEFSVDPPSQGDDSQSPAVADLPRLSPGSQNDLQDVGSESQRRTAGTWDKMCGDFSLGKDDYKNYYTWNNVFLAGLGLAVTAPLANTDADQCVHEWYQRNVRHHDLDRASNGIEYGTNFWIVAPLALETFALARKDHDDYASDGGVFEWSNRCLRTTAVGWPSLILLQAATGGERPVEGPSRWQPFHDLNGVSGHTFMGAIPFLTAASMTENPYWKCPLVLASFASAWGRVNEDRHYFSQVILGWWMAYLATQAVEDTQTWQRALRILPTLTPEGPAMAVHVRY